MRIPPAILLLALAALLVFLTLPSIPQGFEKCMKWENSKNLYLICDSTEFSFEKQDLGLLDEFINSLLSDDRPTTVEMFMKDGKWMCSITLSSGKEVFAPEDVCVLIISTFPVTPYVDSALVGKGINLPTGNL